MAYSAKVVDYNENPRNVGTLDKNSQDVGTGLVGAPSCGDVMCLQIEVVEGRVLDAKFKAFGCGSAIAASSRATEMIIGKTLNELIEMAESINSAIVADLALPPVKYHCSVLARSAILAAIKDYFAKNPTIADGYLNLNVKTDDSHS